MDTLRGLQVGLCCGVITLLSSAARATDIDWSTTGDEAARLLSAYIRVDTTNPPGNETAAAKFLAERFKQAGIDSRVLESAKGRGVVVARLKGRGGARPIVLLNHLDVVPADPAGWDLPPFSGTIRDGYLWGRGALDCKGVGAVDATAMIAVKRAGMKLKRDLIFVATADEEAGGIMGAGWFAERHLDLVPNAEFLLNEGGAIRVRADGSRTYEVAVSEKTPCWLKLTATGEAGHGSAPGAETAVTRLIGALDRLHHYETEVRVVPEVAAYYAALADTAPADRRERYRDLKTAVADPAFREAFLADRHDAALVRDTIAPTVLSGSSKTNVIPRSASAEIDCRLLPDENPETFVRSVQQVVNDQSVTIEKLLSFPPSSSPTDTALYRAIAAVAAREQAAVVPAVLTGFTDSHYFRAHDIVSYGFVPFEVTDDDEKGVHGINERVSLVNLRDGTRRLIEILQALDQEP
ncbi:MAG TPA: M20/M25/M40 family metallo-hydrolase [Candidatus Kryptonia bacterium]|nr:M20/M25/M40 family metallo-hydrolase [Candidatus Kryptonia bacterium]